MSKSDTTVGDTDDVEQLSDDELLERIAAYDPEKCPLAETAQQVLEADQDSDSEGSA